jgi:hypothetical protein
MCSCIRMASARIIKQRTLGQRWTGMHGSTCFARCTSPGVTTRRDAGDAKVKATCCDSTVAGHALKMMCSSRLLFTRLRRLERWWRLAWPDSGGGRDPGNPATNREWSGRPGCDFPNLQRDGATTTFDEQPSACLALSRAFVADSEKAAFLHVLPAPCTAACARIIHLSCPRRVDDTPGRSINNNNNNNNRTTWRT